MWSRQIFVAILCITLAWQQVAAVVNNGQSAKVEESNKSNSEITNSDKPNTSNEGDTVAAGTEESGNRREAPIQLGDTYGAPVSSPADSYLPSGPSNKNLPVPVYGVPDAPTNNIVYPEPPPDIPPPLSLPLPSYGLPVSDTYGPPVNSYLPPPIKSYGAPLTPPKYFGPGPGRIKPTYGPPRFQYGPPGKPLHGSKFAFKVPYKSFGGSKKPLSTYGPPSGYFKDNYNSGKQHNFNLNNLHVSQGNSFSHSSFSGHSSNSNGGVSTQYGVPHGSLDISTINLDLSGLNGVSSQYGAPDIGHSNIGIHSISPQYGPPDTGHSNIGVHSISTQYGAANIGHSNIGVHSISTQYGVPDIGSSNSGIHSISSQYGVPDHDISGPPRHQYGPPQPSPHPRPPHPGAPAPPTPPDIKYDGWQPIPGLVSRVPVSSYGVPPQDHHLSGDLSYNKELVPPPALDNHIEHHHHQHHSSSGHASVASLALENSHGSSQHGVSDSYGAPLNTVTGSGGVVSSSGDEAHGKLQSQSHSQSHSHSGNVNIGISSIGLGQDIQTVKSLEYEVFPSGAGSINGQGHSIGGYSSSISDSYGAPPSTSYSSNGPYAAAHSYNNIKTSGSDFGSLNSHNSYNSYNSFNSHKSHGHKGLSFSNSGIGLIPPSGVYGVPPSGQYGTPLYSGHSHGPLNALKINPPKHPVIHRDPVPPGLFDSLTKQTSYKHGYSGHHSSGSTYLPPPVLDLPKPSNKYGPLAPSSLYSLPNSHSAISFQNINHGSSNLNLNIDGATTSALSSYNAPLNIVDGSYSLPQSQSHIHSGPSGSDIVGLDLSHPGLTIDLTKGNGHHSHTSFSDCSLKSQSLPSLSYGVPSASSYTASLSSLTTNIEGAHTGTSIGGSTYGAPEILPVPAAQSGYEVTERKPHGTYGIPDLEIAHSQKTSVVKTNSIESESQGKSYGNSVAASFGPSSELIQSESLDLNNIPLQGNLGSYTLQIQSVDGAANQVAHGQVLNDGLLQSILAAIEQPQKGGGIVSQPIIQFQKSLEQQNFVTNDTISSVVGQLADAEIRHSTQLAKDAIDKTTELLSDEEIQHSSPIQYVVQPPQAEIKDVKGANDEQSDEQHEDVTLPYLEDNGIALYFSNNQRSKKETADEGNAGENKSAEKSVNNSHK